MPRIQTFDAGNLGLQPTEVGVESVAAAARRQGAFYSQQAAGTEQVGRSIGQMAGSAIRDAGQAAVDYLDHQQISHGAATFAELTANKTDEWNNVVKNADPNDPSVGKQFLETSLEPALEKFRQGFMTEKGQAWAESHIDALRQHMFQKTASDMSTLAGQAAHENARQVVNQLSNAALNDPTTLDFALKTVNSSIEGIVGTSPNLKGTAAGTVRTQISEQAREQIVKSAAIGYIMKTAEVPPWASDPKYSKYINGIELKQFQKTAEAQQKQNFVLNKQIEDYQRKQDDLAARKATSENLTQNFTRDPNSNLPIITPQFIDNAHKILLTHPESREAQEAYKASFRLTQQYQNAEQKVQTNPDVLRNLYDGMFSTDNPTSEIDIMKAEANPDPKQRVNAHDATALHNLYRALQEAPLKGPIYQDTMKAAHAALVVNVPGVPGKDVVGEQNYSKFVQSFIPQYLAAKRSPAGAPPNALDVKDPDSMISKAMAPFHRTVTQRMSDYTEMLGGVPGMTPTAPAEIKPTGFAPPKDWQWSPSIRQYRDPEGNRYDAQGKLIKKK